MSFDPKFALNEILPHARKAYGLDAATNPVRGWECLGLIQPGNFGYVARRDNTVVIALRGTETKGEWFEDFDAKPAACEFKAGVGLEVHCGFQEAYLKVRQSIKEAIYAPCWELFDELLITGHSLGGALATLCSIDLLNDSPRVWTWAGPRVIVGNAAWYSQCETYRIVNAGDIVPHVPAWPYRHVGEEIGVSGPRSTDLKVLHSLDSYQAGLQVIASALK